MIDKLSQWTALGLIVGLAALLPMSASADGVNVSGAITVTKTKAKTTGEKPDNYVVVYLEKAGGHGVAAPKEHAVMDQVGLVFVPHVVAVQKGTTVDFLNSDSVDHNVKCADDCCRVVEGAPGAGKYMDLGVWGKGEVRSYTFNLAGDAALLCQAHPEMAAYLVVIDTPYFVVVQLKDEVPQTGSYTIPNVPPGKYTLKAWNKKLIPGEGAVREITVAAADVSADFEFIKKPRRRRRRR